MDVQLATAESGPGSEAVPDGAGPVTVADTEATGDAVPGAADGLPAVALPEGAAVLAAAVGPALAATEADGAAEPAVRAPGEGVWPSTAPVAVAVVAWPSLPGSQALTDRTSPTATTAPAASRLFIEASPP
ncbi:hypothetical protein [Kitasatospora sp. HPMI-4]|uniref:hypothetical protein n=1 Tax=Kitasatospora sp. HPMI-4 TaxID=3448443 RepID=UPI003F1BF6E4